MKTSKKQYAIFRAEVKHWIHRLGLSKYRIVFRYELLDEMSAQLLTDHKGHIAVFTFADDADAEWEGPEADARHEVFHLLIAKLGWIARQRYIRPDDVSEENESIVQRLMNM